MKLTWIEIENIKEKINLSIGEASMCWKPIPSGIFDSSRALKISEELFEFITREVESHN